ncbi:hypothetical protein X805_30720 [Sphaerotilus natans subsp. natans DSM 6575]|uniref:Uncharacterized protein n=1 Tax=Sphaerotilus natans subsp. natans DSM 6575 TaxID=1286631 RepID=A0A059KIS7_9BURK|nr:hypothetical protein X805_30720 [Sphaerotilus natans subsp. natans DSM 6575]
MLNTVNQVKQHAAEQADCCLCSAAVDVQRQLSVAMDRVTHCVRD